ncbi:unnamed protein product [Caenorhabditis auriculariae]|uniref:Acyl_transf_3 domain-containing protein n=1 Tax=Caenorhabditis auriculariae TaxID=2777116 RepID=A0A8S1HIB0_9PELO|nr:unnamed protein product [Caenorhabditis auriculariae]
MAAPRVKRDDLQGLRGVAIAAVILFHFFPALFPNGYVGVDQFFVLSGFLMTMIYGSKEITKESTIDFYYRRVKRILPLYLFVICCGLIFVCFGFPSTFFPINVDSAINSVILYSNMAHHTARNEYFVMLRQAEDVFTHTWSLCVEMQFYVLAPLFFLVLSLLQSDWLSSTVYLWAILAASLVFHLVADAHTSFNNVLCRIWQFTMGCMAFFVSDYLLTIDTKPMGYDQANLLDSEAEEDKEDDVEDLELNRPPPKPEQRLPRFPFHVIHFCSLVIMLFCAFSTTTIPPPITRIATTLFTGMLIACGGLVSSHALQNKHMVYLGDVSYCLYLVHWPIYVFVKHYKEGDVPSYILAIIASYTIAVFLSETFEKFYLKLSAKPIFAMIFVFYLFVALAALLQEPIMSQVERLKYGAEKAVNVSEVQNITLEEAIKINNKWAREEYKMLILQQCFPNKNEHGYCEFNKTTLNGNLNMFVLGNSYTANLAGLVYENFKEKAKKMSKFSQSYCEVLTIKAGRCKAINNDYLKRISDAKPEVLFIIDKHDKLNDPVQAPVATDKIFLEALSTLHKYESVVSKKIYMMDSIPLPATRSLTVLATLLSHNDTINDKEMMQDLKYTNGNLRLKELVSRCPKCELINTSSSFFADGAIKFYDHETNLGYFFDGQHLTPAGQKLINHAFADAAKTLK